MADAPTLTSTASIDSAQPATQSLRDPSPDEDCDQPSLEALLRSFQRPAANRPLAPEIPATPSPKPRRPTPTASPAASQSTGTVEGAVKRSPFRHVPRWSPRWQQERRQKKQQDKILDSLITASPPADPEWPRQIQEEASTISAGEEQLEPQQQEGGDQTQEKETEPTVSAGEEQQQQEEEEETESTISAGEEQEQQESLSSSGAQLPSRQAWPSQVFSAILESPALATQQPCSPRPQSFAIPESPALATDQDLNMGKINHVSAAHHGQLTPLVYVPKTDWTSALPTSPW